MRVIRSPQEGGLPHWAWVAFLERPSAKSWAPGDSECPSLDQVYGGAAALAVCAGESEADAWLA